MSFDPTIWSKMHGAVTHFPIALTLVSALCDAAGLIPIASEHQRGFRFAASLTLTLGALGSYAAIGSGLILSRWQAWGHGTLLRHHQFVWPAFILMTGLAAWRLTTLRNSDERPPTAYLALMALTVLLISGAGYWGGELLNQG